MPTGDGLLARLMPPDGRLTAGQLRGLAEAAARCGNGIVEVTARGSVQVRGLRANTVAPFAATLAGLGLDAPAGPTLHVGPLAGLDPAAQADPRPLAAALRALPPVAGLSPKLAVVLDGGGDLSLDGLSADIRLVAQDAERWLVGLDDTPLGLVAAGRAPAVVDALLAAIAARGATARGRDLRTAAPELRRRLKLDAPPPRRHAPAGDPIGRMAVGNHTVVGIALAFGQAEAGELVALAEGADEFRLAPGRVLLAVDPPADFFSRAERLGFIVGAGDPRRAIAACPGAPRCASGLIDARGIAAALARALDRPRAIHVSGCAKGCAHPAPAALTVVGTEAGAALVRDGTARDAAWITVPADRVVAAVAAEAVAA
jgi:precorrin-3B synthase